jgi:hypothetical protein
LVNVADIGGARANPHAGGFLDTAPVEDLWDFNKDGRVNTADQGIARAKTQPVSFFRLDHFTAPEAGMLSSGNLTGDDGGLLVAALTGGDSGWSDLDSGSASSSSSGGSSAAADERIWADDEDEDGGAGASSVDAALEDASDWLDEGWEIL